MKLLYFCLWLDNSIVYMYPYFLIHFSVDGHVGWFYILAIVDSVATNMDIWVFCGMLT